MSLNQKRDESGTKMIPIEFIEIAPGRRALRPLVVERFAASMTDIGLRTPITVRYFPRSADRGTPNSYLLVVGAHRLAAARLLGWREIRAFVITGDDIKDSDVELWEIDENLMRAEPDAAEHALLTKRRAEIMEAKAQEEAVSQSATPLSKQARPRGRARARIRSRVPGSVGRSSAMTPCAG